MMAFETDRFKRRLLKAGSMFLCALIMVQLKMRNENPVQLLFETAFPAAGYDSDDYAGSFLEKGTSFVAECLFPGTAYLYHQNGRNEATAAEFYPTAAELGHFDNENKSESERVQDELIKKAGEENAAAIEESSAQSAGADASDTAKTDAAPGEPEAKTAVSANAAPASSGTIYPMSSLLDYDFLMSQFFIVDSSTSCDSSVIEPQTLLSKDLTMPLTGEEPKILIYHTHSQESFADSVPGDEYGTVIGLGNTLTDILENKYGVSVYHDKGVYDMIDGVHDRDKAYSMALPVVEQILKDNPSIKVVIDLHRDGVDEDVRLVTNTNGKPTAKVMFFNGLCRGAVSGTNGYIQNPYLTDNLAFSLQLQLKAEEKYPDFMRRIYLRSYRFNMHVAPRTLLVECGAQTNTVEEVHNAMEPLADILYSVLSGT